MSKKTKVRAELEHKAREYGKSIITLGNALSNGSLDGFSDDRLRAIVHDCYPKSGHEPRREAEKIARSN